MVGKIQALYQVTVLLVLNFRGTTILNLEDDRDHVHAVKVKNTLIFNAFVFCQVSLLAQIKYIQGKTSSFMCLIILDKCTF